jgi:hypothetical protein
MERGCHPAHQYHNTKPRYQRTVDPMVEQLELVLHSSGDYAGQSGGSLLDTWAGIYAESVVDW